MMKIELQRWALAADVFGGIAVVATLIFLVLETRENTNAIQAQTYQSLTSELNEHRRESAGAEMAVIFKKYEDTGLDSLSGLEKYRIMMNTEAKWGVYESSFYAQERDVLGADEWVRFEIAICRNFKFDESLWVTQAQGSKLTIGGIAQNVTPKFRAYVEGKCS
jgi:hypothetical protein